MRPGKAIGFSRQRGRAGAVVGRIYTRIKSAAAVTAAAAGTSHLIVRLAGHQDRGATGGAVLGHRRQDGLTSGAAGGMPLCGRPQIGGERAVHPGRDGLGVETARGVRDRGVAKRARQQAVDRSLADPSDDCPADAFGRSSFTSSSSYRTIRLHNLAGDIVEVERTRVFQGVFEAPGDLIVAKPCFRAEVPLDGLAELPPGSRSCREAVASCSPRTRPVCASVSCSV